MKLPKKLKILSMEYRIEYVDNARDADWGDGEKVRGSVCWDEDTIKIFKANRGIQDIWRTILHEVLHIIIWTLSIDATSEERYAAQMSAAWNSFLWENGILKKEDPQKKKNEHKKKN